VALEPKGFLVLELNCQFFKKYSYPLSIGVGKDTQNLVPAVAGGDAHTADMFVDERGQGRDDLLDRNVIRVLVYRPQILDEEQDNGEFFKGS